MKKLHIKTWGCQMNVYDSGRMTDVVAPLGFAPTDDASDADLVIFDPAYRGTISAATQHTNCDYNGFEGFAVDGRASIVTVRGKVQVRDGKFVGERGRGRLLKREPGYASGAGLRPAGAPL